MICFRPIGVVRTPYPDEEVKRRGSVEGCVEVFPEYAEGLSGIDGFSHLILIAYLHKHEDKPIKVRPRRLLRYGFSLEELPEVGVFATDSPDRPNPIALTIVRLLRRDGSRLLVEGLDLFDGTPVLDIKPYTPGRAVARVSVPEWYSRLAEELRRRKGVDIKEI